MFQCQNKLAVSQAQKAVENCKAEFANEMAVLDALGTPNRLAKKCAKKSKTM